MLVELDGGEFGIVTDRDLRSHVVAGRLSPDDQVSAAMSSPVVGVGADQTGADVMLTMLDHDVRHVPVFSRLGEVLGVIVAIDLVAAETSSPFVLRRAIARARNKNDLQEAAGRLRSMVVTLHRAELAPFHVSDVVLGRLGCPDPPNDRAGNRVRRDSPQSSPGCPWAATAGGSRCRPRTSTAGWPGGIVPDAGFDHDRTAPPAGFDSHDRLHAADRR